MSNQDPRIESFFNEAKNWRGELQALREILLGCSLAEEFKWRSPCYTAAGGNVATVWGMKEYCALSFFKGVLLTDPEGILHAPGENSRSVRLAKFTSADEIRSMEQTLKDYVLEAAANERKGHKVAFPKDDLDYPGELTERLYADDAFREAFEALTPGRRRGYVLHFSQPKQAKTRIARIEKHAPRIFEGKGMHDR